MLKEKYYCKVLGCNNLSRANTTNSRFTKELCDEHYNKKFKHKCNQCGKEIELLAMTYIKAINNPEWVCQNCHRVNNAKKYRGSEKQKEHLKKLNPGKILKNYYSNPDNKEAIRNKMLKHNRSEVMIKASKRNCEKYFKPYRESEEFREHILNHNSAKFYKICNKITVHVGDRCFNCNPWNFNCEPNFKLENNVLYYKNENWLEYKRKFRTQKINNEFEKYNGFWQKTYRINNIDSTGQDAMEMELIEKGIKWFVYIKFYKDGKDIKPLSVGKSGSKLVNQSGSDVSFGYDDKGYKAAVKFLNEENLKWLNKQIYLIPCETEKDTLDLEKKIQKEFNLYG